MVFATRQAARDYITSNYAWFKRPDLKAEPHGWMYPQVVKVAVAITEITP